MNGDSIQRDFECQKAFNGIVHAYLSYLNSVISTALNEPEKITHIVNKWQKVRKKLENDLQDGLRCSTWKRANDFNAEYLDIFMKIAASMDAFISLVVMHSQSQQD